MAVENVAQFFETNLPERLTGNPQLAEQVGAIYKFVVEGDGGGTWRVDLTSAPGAVTAGDGEANCTIALQTQDLLDVLNGVLNAQMAFMGGKLRIEGDMALALKLGALLG